MYAKYLKKNNINNRSIIVALFSGEEIGLKGSVSQIEELFFPPVGEGAEIIEGTMDEKAEALVKILKERGGIA